MFHSVKDAVTAKLAQMYVNRKIERYGQVSHLKLDSHSKSAEFTCALQGETEPVLVRVGRYVVHEVGDQRFIEVTQISCSRPWLENLLVDFGRSRRVELPAWAAGAL